MDRRLAAFCLALAGCAAVPGPSQPAPSLKFVTIDGDALAYVQTGAGDPLLFVHGGFQDYRMWQSAMREFSRSYRTIAYSRRNHYPNRVDVDGLPDSAADQHGADLEQMVEALGPGPIHLVAHSAGAHAALFFAAKRPDLIRTLVIVEPPAAALLTNADDDVSAMAEFNGRFGQAMAALRGGDVPSAVRLFADAVGGPGTYERRTPSQRAMMIDNVAAHVADARTGRPRPRFTCEMAKRISAPVLLVNGSRSPAFFHHIADRLSACLTNVKRIAIDSSHTVPSENPRAFHQALRTFLGEARR
jgi:non-heme chloroperoxidase